MIKFEAKKDEVKKIDTKEQMADILCSSQFEIALWVLNILFIDILYFSYILSR